MKTQVIQKTLRAPSSSNEATSRFPFRVAGNCRRWPWLVALVLVSAQLALAQSATLALTDYSTSGATIRLQASPGQTWAILYAANLSDPNWTVLDTITLTDTNMAEIVDHNAGSLTRRFYRGDTLASIKSSAQVYTVNIVGFQKQIIAPGMNLVANPFTGTNQALSLSMPNTPDGTLLWRSSGNGFAWDLNWFSQSSGWANPDMSPFGGEPFWLYNPLGANYTLAFKGDIVTVPPFGFGGAGYYLSSAIYSFDVYNLPPAAQIFKWSPPLHTYAIYTYDADFQEWDPMEPTFSFGEPFVILNPGNFSCYLTPMPLYPIHVPPGVTFSALPLAPGFGQGFDPCGAPLSGCRFQAQFFGGTNGIESDFAPLTTASCFLNGPLAGTLAPTLLVNPFSPADIPLSVKLRVWDQNGGVNYLAAVTNGARTGQIEIFWGALPSLPPEPPVLAPPFTNFTVSAFVLPAAMDTCGVIKLCAPIGSQYRVDWAWTLYTNNWHVLTNVIVFANPCVIVDADSANQTQRFYRAVKQP